MKKYKYYIIKKLIYVKSRYDYIKKKKKYIIKKKNDNRDINKYKI